jgi:hypothetical protein
MDSKSSKVDRTHPVLVRVVMQKKLTKNLFSKHAPAFTSTHFLSQAMLGKWVTEVNADFYFRMKLLIVE